MEAALNADKSEFLKSLAELDLGAHLCLVYETRKEQFAAVIPFIKLGLEKKEKCVYIADDNTVQDVKKAMMAVDRKLFSSALDDGSLSVLTKKETYMKGGYFSPEKMMDLLKKSINDALAAGYTGLRVTGEMTWMLANELGSEKLIEYEAKLNDFFPGSHLCAICQYNRKRFPNELLIDVFRTHPFVIYKSKIVENPLYLSPKEFFNNHKKK